MGPRAGRKEEGRSVVVIVIVIVELATATATTARWNGCVRGSGCRARWCHVTSRHVTSRHVKWRGGEARSCMATWPRGRGVTCFVDGPL
jgi:hypothetical protein